MKKENKEFLSAVILSGLSKGQYFKSEVKQMFMENDERQKTNFRFLFCAAINSSWLIGITLKRSILAIFSLNSREKSNFTRADVVKIMLKLLANVKYLLKQRPTGF